MPEPHRDPAFVPTAVPAPPVAREESWQPTLAPPLRPPHLGAPEDCTARPAGVPRNQVTEEVIGEGGIGRVLRGRDTDLGREIAVKVLKDQYRHDDEAQRRFLQEARIGGRLQHPSIVPVYEVGRFPDGRPFFTMKLIRGRTLGQLFQERPDPLHELGRFVTIFEQVCQAMACAHARGVVHRDLKPQNVMVGEFGEVQVMDWGLAKELARAGTGPDSPGEVTQPPAFGEETATGMVGTPAYMPPEQARGAGLTPRAEVFGMGGILCTLLTGRPPFRDATASLMLEHAAQGDVSEAFARLDQCGADRELIDLCKSCLQPEPKARPPDAGAVARRVADYQAAVRERLRQAERQRAAAEARAVDERQRRRLTAALAAALLLLVVTGVAGAWYVQRQRYATDEDVRAKLAQAREALQAGWEAASDARLREAHEAAGVAVRMAQTGSSRGVQREAVEVEREVADRVERARKNRDLVNSLRGIYHPSESDENNLSMNRPDLDTAVDKLARSLPTRLDVDRLFADAFARWGLAVDATPLKDAQPLIRQQPRPVVLEILVALDAWAVHRRANNQPRAKWQGLSELADALDDNADNRDLRRLLLGTRKAAELVTLADKVDLAREPVPRVLMLSRALQETGNTMRAARLLQEAVCAHPAEAILLTHLGHLLESLQRYPEAVEYHRAAQARRPGPGFALAQALVKAGRLEDAEALLEAAQTHQPNNVNLRFRLGFFWWNLTERERAARAFRQAVVLEPENGRAYHMLGVILASQGHRQREAEEAYRKSLALRPDDAEVHYDLGVLLQSQKRLPETVAAYQQALALDPQDPRALNNLGIALRDRGNLKQARPYFPKASDTFLQKQGIPLTTEVLIKTYNTPQFKDVPGSEDFRKALKNPQFLEVMNRYVNNLAMTNRWLKFEDLLPELLAGRETLPQAQEYWDLSVFCQDFRRDPHRATYFKRQAFTLTPGLADILSRRYVAATCAVEAGAGKSSVALPDKVTAAYRKWALDGLRTEVRHHTRAIASQDPGERGVDRTRRHLTEWLEFDPALAPVRDPAALALLPEAERRAWELLWQDVAALRRLVEQPK